MFTLKNHTDLSGEVEVLLSTVLFRPKPENHWEVIPSTDRD